MTVLVIGRREKESFLVGPDIEVTILEVHGDSVKIGIDAPRSLQIWRKELFEEIVKENLKAASERDVSQAEALLRPRKK